MLNHKTGICIDCTDGKEKPIIAKRCNYHYRKYRASKWKVKEKDTVKRRTPTKQPTPIAKESKKQARQNRIYYKEKAIYLAELAEKTDGYPICEARLEGCTGKATDLHHKEGRGKNLTVKSKFLGLCRNCHNRVEASKKMAIKEGYSLSRIKATNGLQSNNN